MLSKPIFSFILMESKFKPKRILSVLLTVTFVVGS